MSTFSQDITAAQAVLDLHQSVPKKIETANRACLEAVQTLMEFDDPEAGNIFGADQETLNRLVATPRAKILPILMKGLPIFSLRLATKNFIAVIQNRQGDDAALEVLLKSFAAPIPLSSLSAPDDTSASQAILDRHQSVRLKIEFANRACLDAIQALADFDDPMAGNIFGADQAILKQLSATPRAQILPIMMTGIPIFTLRLATPDFVAVLENKPGDEAALNALIKSFAQPIAVGSF